MFKAVYDEFNRTLASQNSQLYTMLLKQEAFINKIAAAQRMVRPVSRRHFSPMMALLVCRLPDFYLNWLRELKTPWAFDFRGARRRAGRTSRRRSFGGCLPNQSSRPRRSRTENTSPSHSTPTSP